MDITDFLEFMNSQSGRDTKVIAGGVMAVLGITTIARRKLIGSACLLSGAACVGTAMLDICPANLIAGLPITGPEAREQL